MDKTVVKSVGIRDLKNSLSEYLREVRNGKTVLITDRGTVVAELREPHMVYGTAPDYTVMERWIEEGSVRPPLVAKRPIFSTNVHLPNGASQTLLDQDRGA